MAIDKPVTSSQVTRFREQTNRWKSFCETEILNIDLQKGLEIHVAADKIGKAKPSVNKVVDWSYQIGESGNSLVLEIVLREQLKSRVSDPGFYARLTEDQRKTVSTITAFFALLTVVVPVGILYILANYPNPDWVWIFIGQNVRFWVGLMSFIVLAVFVPIAAGVYSFPMGIAGIFWGQVCLFLGIFVSIYWYFAISQPPPGLSPEQNPIAYLNYLGNSSNTGLRIGLSGMTFLSFVLPLIGKEAWAKLIEAFLKQMKKTS